MSVFYSPSTGGFYRSEFHGGNIPQDALEITEEEHSSLSGRVVFSDASGRPVLLAAPTPDPADHERAWRDTALSEAMWLRERHRDQLEIEVPTSIDGGQFKDLLRYIQSLRDWPQSANFPDAQYRPAAPPWITEQVE